MQTKLNKNLVRWLKDTKRYNRFKKSFIAIYTGNVMHSPFSLPSIDDTFMFYLAVMHDRMFCDYFVTKHEEEMKNAFKNFIKGFGCSRNYELNKIKYGLNIKDEYSPYVKYKELVNHAFTWRDTKEGWDYWNDVNTAWIDTFKKFMNEKVSK